MPRAFVGAAAALALVLLSAAAPALARPPYGMQVTTWALPSTPDRLVNGNASSLTTLAVSGVMLDGSATAMTRATPDMTRLARTAHRSHLRTELVVTNYSNPLGDFDPAALHRLLSNADDITQVVAAVAADVRRGPWDGVNVDFEQVRAADGPGLVAFVTALQQAMPAAKTLSIDVSACGTANAYRQQGYRLAELRSQVDVFDLMAYDYSGPTWSKPGPIGPLPWQRRALGAMLGLVPARKVQLGVAGYGYTWPTKGVGRSVSDRQARALVERDGATAVWRPGAGEWSATLPNGTTVWWSDGRSYRLRLDLARSLHLRGTAVWRLGSADPLP